MPFRNKENYLSKYDIGIFLFELKLILVTSIKVGVAFSYLQSIYYPKFSHYSDFEPVWCYSLLNISHFRSLMYQLLISLTMADEINTSNSVPNVLKLEVAIIIGLWWFNLITVLVSSLIALGWESLISFRWGGNSITEWLRWFCFVNVRKVKSC